MVYNVRAPALPTPPVEYDKAQQDQFENALRLYFNRLDNYLAGLSTSGSTGGSQLYFPYGAFSSNQDQTTTANTATLMTLNTTDFANGVSISSSKMTVANAGIYNLQFSVQLENADNAPQDVFIWLKQNGVDIVGSTGKVGIPARKSQLRDKVVAVAKTIMRKPNFQTTSTKLTFEQIQVEGRVI